MILHTAAVVLHTTMHVGNKKAARSIVVQAINEGTVLETSS